MSNDGQYNGCSRVAFSADNHCCVRLEVRTACPSTETWRGLVTTREEFLSGKRYRMRQSDSNGNHHQALR